MDADRHPAAIMVLMAFVGFSDPLSQVSPKPDDIVSSLVLIVKPSAARCMMPCKVVFSGTSPIWIAYQCEASVFSEERSRRGSLLRNIPSQETDDRYDLKMNTERKYDFQKIRSLELRQIIESRMCKPRSAESRNGLLQQRKDSSLSLAVDTTHSDEAWRRAPCNRHNGSYDSGIRLTLGGVMAKYLEQPQFPRHLGDAAREEAFFDSASRRHPRYPRSAGSPIVESDHGGPS